MCIPKSAAHIRGRRLVEARPLLEEIEYFSAIIIKIHKQSCIFHFMVFLFQ